MKGKKLLRQTERGNVVDYIAAIFIMLFLFACTLALINYSKIIQMRLKADNIAKTYLYKMEENGYLKSISLSGGYSDKEALINAFEEAGFNDVNILTDTTTKQVAYGDEIVLAVSLSMSNPLYDAFGGSKERYLFGIKGLDRTFTFQIRMKSTSKW